MLTVKKTRLAWVPREAPAILLEMNRSRRPPPPGLWLASRRLRATLGCAEGLPPTFAGKRLKTKLSTLPRPGSEQLPPVAKKIKREEATAPSPAPALEGRGQLRAARHLRGHMGLAADGEQRGLTRAQRGAGGG